MLTRSTRIDVCDLPQPVIDNSTGKLLPAHARPGNAPWEMGAFNAMPLRDALQEPEKQIILAALEANNWNRQKTAQVLDINRTTLYKKIKQYGLEEYGEAG